MSTPTTPFTSRGSPTHPLCSYFYIDHTKNTIFFSPSTQHAPRTLPLGSRHSALCTAPKVIDGWNISILTLLSAAFIIPFLLHHASVESMIVVGVLPRSIRFTSVFATTNREDVSYLSLYIQSTICNRTLKHHIAGSICFNKRWPPKVCACSTAL